MAEGNNAPDQRIAPGVETPSRAPEASPKRGLGPKQKLIAAIIASLCIVLVAVSAVSLLNQPAAATVSTSADAGQTSAASSSTASGAKADSPAQTSAAADGQQATASATESATTETPDAVSSSPAAASSSGNGSSTPAAAQADTVTVHVSVSSDAADGSVSGSKTVTFEKGATAYDALCSLGFSVNASSSQYGVYVKAVGGLAEKAYGGKSGWVYTANGVDPGRSCSTYTLQDGDNISWSYVK